MSEAAQRPIVVAYDGSDPAKAAIEAAGAVLEPGRRVLVLTVWEPITAVPFWGAPLGTAAGSLVEEVAANAKAIAVEGATLAESSGLAAEPEVREGSPVWRTITRFAEDEDAELIVIGSHGRSGLGYVMAGSVATAVMHHADCSVLVSRTAADE
jgi:nucleotide-binding universal stress UspA family protein